MCCVTVARMHALMLQLFAESEAEKEKTVHNINTPHDRTISYYSKCVNVLRIRIHTETAKLAGAQTQTPTRVSTNTAHLLTREISNNKTLQKHRKKHRNT